MEEWYFEYHIHHDRFGLLGDIASVLGMLSINIETVSGVAERRRGFLLRTNEPERIETLKGILRQVGNITVTALRPPTLLDRLALRHGRLIEQDDETSKVFRFTREDLGILVDFMGEHLKTPGHQVMGVRGMPRVERQSRSSRRAFTQESAGHLSVQHCSNRRCEPIWTKMN